MKKPILFSCLLLLHYPAFCWGFYAHTQINYYAVFLLPPEMAVLFKPNINFLAAHATDPDKRRYILPAEAPRHFIDIDLYTQSSTALPQSWDSALAHIPSATLYARGIVPWWTIIMLKRLTLAFKEKDAAKILKLSAELGHYIADAHVPLHASSNHNGQFTHQQGIHAFWESRIPELLAEKEWDFFIGKAEYLPRPAAFIWKKVYESASAADTVLRTEKKLSLQTGDDIRFAFEEKNGKLVRQYASAYTRAYDLALHGMVQKRMREAIFAVASFWYTAWVNAGQPDLKPLTTQSFSAADIKAFDSLDLAWKNHGAPEDTENY